MDQDDQRDYAEEAANRQLMQEHDELDTSPASFVYFSNPAYVRSEEEMSALRTFAEDALKFYNLVARHPDRDICAYDTISYTKTRMVLFQAIGMAYPDLSDSDITEIYEVLVDSGENVAYAVSYHKENGSI